MHDVDACEHLSSWPFSRLIRRRAGAAMSARRPGRLPMRFGTGGRPGVRSGFLHTEQAGPVAAQNCHLLFVGEGGGEDVIDRMLLPRDRMVAAEHDLSCAHLDHQMPKAL